MQHQLTLRICVFAPVGSHVRRAIVQHHIALLIFQLFPELLVACRSGDVALEAAGAGNALNGIEVHAYDGGVEGHAFACDLHPATRSST